MKQNQRGFAHVFIILAVIVIGLIGFAGYRVFTKSNETANNSAAKGSEYGEFATLEDCVKHYSKPGVDPSAANDTCINLKNAAAQASQQSQKPGEFIPADDSQAGKKAPSCSPEAALADAKGEFKELPFDVSNIRIVTLGKETNDPRFLYPWVKNDKVNIYAPADGVLYMIRHKVFVDQGKNGNDYDIFFKVDCGTVYRFNHISDPRDDIKAAYPAGDLPSGDYANGGTDIPERVKPVTNIKVKAGEPLGSTTGTPGAHSFDFAVGVAAEAPNPGDPMSVCPFSVFNEPHKTTLMGLLGPKNGSPTPGFACDVESKKF